MSRFRLPALVLLLVILVCAPADARVVSELDIRMEPPDSGAVPGQLYEGRLQILAGRDLTLTDFTIEGRNWRSLNWTPVQSARLGPAQPLVVEFSGVPTDAAAPLVITVRTDEGSVRRTFTVGGTEFARHRSALPMREADFPVPDPWKNAWASSLSPRPAAPDEEPAPANKDAQGYDIRVRGRFIYVRDGTTIIGGDGLTIRVYDDDPVFDDLLGSSITDAYGYFDFTVNWDDLLGEDHPDLKVQFRTENSEVIVKQWYMVTPYIIEVGPWNNYTGTDLDLGVVLPGNEEDQAIPHLMTNYTRFWRYLHGHGHDTRFLKVYWPDSEDDGAFYNSFTEVVHLAGTDRWDSGTQSHEFGHHVMHCLSDLPSLDYCNGTCDPNEPWNCGHCIFCEEDVSIAWSEGWADYFGHAVPKTFNPSYGTPCINDYMLGSVQTCQEDDLWDEPLVTEGFTAAVLADIDDNVWDDDPRFPGFDDRASLGGQALLDVLHSDNAMTTMSYLHDLIDHFPSQKEDIWWTAMNNGLDPDREIPDVVYPIIAVSGHTTGVPSPNPNLAFAWQRPDDDASGVRYYIVTLTQDAPSFPSGGRYIEGDTRTEFNDLVPATYYFNIVPQDWSGKHNPTYTSSGPYIITAPEPRNLVFDLPTGWDFWVVPRNTPDAAMDLCPMPPILDAGLPTYWNLAARNEGDLYTGAHVHTTLEMDGVEVGDFNWGDVPGWSPMIVLNGGPELVYGGLHSFVGRLDRDDLVSETDENDNTTGRQFSWRPQMINAIDHYSYPFGVPDPTGGWEDVIDMFKFYNSYGVGFVSSAWWNALVVWSDDPDTDYDLRLHEVNTAAMGGFLSYTDASTQPAGWADAVVVNRNNAGSTGWDGAVVNPRLDTGMLRYRQVTSQEVAFPDSIVEVMGSSDYLFLREFEIGQFETGGLSLDLWTDPPQANVGFSWCDTDFMTGAFMETDGVALTGADGHAHLDVVAAEEGYTCLMISRRPMDGDDDLQVTYRIRTRLPDLEPAHLAGWHAPIVPRTYGTHTPELVELPTVLEGDVEQTWFSFAVANSSTGTALGAMRFQVHLDGYLAGINYMHAFDILGGEYCTILDQGPRTVRGGRHTVVVYPDAPNYMTELDEQNNKYGEQYVWVPRTMDWDGVETRSAPPEMVGGWEDIASGDPAFFNCDGMRPAYMSTSWRAYAVMPGAESDVDVRLHEIAAGTQTGFGVNLVRSGWGIGESDYVLINHYLADWMPFDAGVLRILGDEDYTREAPMESMLGSAPVDHGPVELAAGRIMHLYEVNLTAGFWRIHLENTAGAVDWGLTLHRNDLPFMSKTDTHPGGAAWLEGPGTDEEITFTIDEQGYYAVTVWKVGTPDLDLAGSYILHVAAWDPSGTEVDELPQVTRVAGIYPNPFNPQTTVQFDLAQPAQVDLTVYDLAGRRVATLVREAYPAGHHRQVWLGRDDSGRQVASGVYLVRLKAGNVTDLKKVMLVK